VSNAALPPELDPRGRHRGHASHGGRGAVAKPLGLVVGTLLSVSLLVLAGYLWVTFRDINNGLNRPKNITVGVAPKNRAQPAAFQGTDQNILLVGNDDRTAMTNAEVKELKVGRDGGSLATDTMIILHVPADGSKATLISLPRDSWVHIPGYGYNRINSAYADGYNNTHGSRQTREGAGANLLIQTVQNLTGLTIDHYVQVSLLGFYEISNAIGGVPINLCQSVNDTHAHNVATGQDGGSGFKMSKGHHVIQGVTALEFVRQRHNLPGGDLDRVKRQQYFLAQAFRQVASVGIISKLHALGTAIKRNIIVDPSLNIFDLAKQMENLSGENINGKTIPTTPQTIDGNDVLAVNPKQVEAFVAKAVSGTTSGTHHGHKKHKSSNNPANAKCVN
jgi:LCP family protein required for cell wall assembly